MFDNSNFDEHQYETYDNVRHEICSLIEQEKYKDILDVGCGCGYMSKELALTFPNANIFSIDVVNEYVKIAQKNFGNFKNIHFAQKDFENVDGEFDLIVVFNALTELLKTKSINDIDSKLNKLCSINGTIMLIEEFSNDFKKGLCLTKKINQLIGYKYISINFLKNKIKHFRLVYSRIYNLKGQKLNAEGTAHYISYECMLNHNDGTYGLSPLEIWKRYKKDILKNNGIVINSKIRLCIFRRLVK